MKIRPFSTFLIVSSILLPAFAAHPKTSDDKVWIIVRPVQCMSNPWEKEWLDKNNNEPSKYPRAHEFDVMRNYFHRKGVPVLEIREKPYRRGDPICDTCDCIRGDTLFLLIVADNVRKMVKLGYTERMPADEVPAPKPKSKKK